MRGLKLIRAIGDASYLRILAVLVAFALLLSLASGGSVAPPSLVAAGLVKTPKQQAGTAKGRPHQVTSNQTAAKPDRKSRTPRRPKGAPELEKKFTPKVVSKTDAKRPASPKTAAAKVMPKREPVKVTGFDPKKSVEDPTQRTRFAFQ